MEWPAAASGSADRFRFFEGDRVALTKKMGMGYMIKLRGAGASKKAKVWIEMI